MFYQQYLKLCGSAGLSPSKAATQAGFSSAHATHWKHGSEPNDSTKLKLAEFFGVDVSYFSEDENGPTETSGKKEKSPTVLGGGLEQAAYSALSPENQLKVREYIALLLNAQSNQ